MALLIRCPTDEAIILAGFVEAPSGVMRYPSASMEIPGVRLRPKPGVALHDQLRQAVQGYVQLHGLPDLGEWTFNLNHGYEDSIEIANQSPLTIYVAQVTCNQTIPKTWPTMADLLRAMPKTRTRLPYMRALQLLSIGIKEDIRVVESDKLPF